MNFLNVLESSDQDLNNDNEENLFNFYLGYFEAELEELCRNKSLGITAKYKISPESERTTLDNYSDEDVKRFEKQYKYIGYIQWILGTILDYYILEKLNEDQLLKDLFAAQNFCLLRECLEVWN